MSKVTKEFKRFTSRAGKEIRRTGRKTEQGVRSAGRQLDQSFREHSAFLEHELKKPGQNLKGIANIFNPDIPDIHIPKSPAGAFQVSAPTGLGITAPTVDVAATEGERRASGSAVSTRKLRRTLGGTGTGGLRI